MQDRSGAERPVARSSALPARSARERRRALVVCAVLALHAAFFGNIGGLVTGAVESTVAPMSVRTVAAELPADAPVETEAPVATSTIVPVLAAPVPAVRPSPHLRGVAAAKQGAAGDAEQASTDSSAPGSAVATRSIDASSASAVDAPTATAAEAAEPQTRPVADVAETQIAPAASTAAGARPALLAPGEEPPPVYRTHLPPSVTLHYQVRRGVLRGTGTIRWEASGDRYRLALEAQAAGIALLRQTSEGGIDASGLAPVRFLDQRARRSAVAANFRRDDGRITFSGSAVEWPLLPGSQDRLSWMIQLAGIAAAEPEQLVDGGHIAMVVVGARGDASVWTLRYAGRETIETAAGSVQAVKLLREGRSAYDTSAEIWLDPERSHLPVRATLRNSTGASEYDLLLERIDPG